MTTPKPPFLTLKRRKENDEDGYLLLQNKSKDFNLVTFQCS